MNQDISKLLAGINVLDQTNSSTGRPYTTIATKGSSNLLVNFALEPSGVMLPFVSKNKKVMVISLMIRLAEPSLHGEHVCARQ